MRGSASCPRACPSTAHSPKPGESSPRDTSETPSQPAPHWRQVRAQPRLLAHPQCRVSQPPAASLHPPPQAAATKGLLARRLGLGGFEGAAMAASLHPLDHDFFTNSCGYNPMIDETIGGAAFSNASHGEEKSRRTASPAWAGTGGPQADRNSRTRASCAGSRLGGGPGTH